MKRLNFDIKYRPEIESGKYAVQTRDGRDVRILCWDADNYLPICAQFHLCAGTLVAKYFDSNGIYNGYTDTKNDYDIFILTDEPELSEFEKQFAAILDSFNGVEIDVSVAVSVYAPALLDLARKELEPVFEKRLEEAYANQDRVVYEKGKADAMLNLPRWSDSNMNDYYSKNRYEIIRMGGGTLYLVDLCMNKKIRISDLRMLPGLVD